MTVMFRGKPACECLASWLPVYERLLQARGILAGELHIYQLIGGAAASAGMHSKGGAFDLLDLPGDEDVALARQMGADATWSRPLGWDGKGGMPHIHGVLTGCPHNGPARYQIDAVRAGFNGLGHLGHGAPDTGPRPLSGRTWQQGIAWANQQMEDDMAWSDQIVKWWPGKAKGSAPVKMGAGQQLNQARGYAQEAYASARRCEAAIAALAAAQGPTIQSAVEKAMADATVKVNVTVAGGDNE